MPLLPFGDSLYSASSRKSLNFSLDTRLLPCGSLVIAPSATDHIIALSLFCTPHASIHLPSNSITGLRNVCLALASQAPQVGGRSPATFVVPTVPVKVLPEACSVTVGRFCAVPPIMNDSSLPLSFTFSAATGLPDRFRKM